MKYFIQQIRPTLEVSLIDKKGKHERVDIKVSSDDIAGVFIVFNTLEAARQYVGNNKVLITPIKI